MIRTTLLTDRLGLQLARSVRVIRGASSLTTAADEEQQQAKAWFATYSQNKIAPEICTVTYSRSSGPGGQKVNKTSSKALLRLVLDEIVPKPPNIILEQLANSRFATDKGRALLFHSDTSRKQGDNKDECFDKLDELIQACCSNVIKNETTPEQLKKIEKLKTASNQRRLAAKKFHSAKKSSRRGS